MPPKRLQQTAGGPLEYVLSGQGRPVWLLFNGAGVMLEGWRELYPAIEQLGTVLAWNRLGVGRSGRPAAPQTGAMVVAGLRELLAHRGLAPPYCLVGHSLGGLHASLFARLYPQEVQGVVLLEATHPGQREFLRAQSGRLATVLQRMLSAPKAWFGANLQAELACVDETARQVAAAGPFPEVPLMVVSAGRDPPRWLVAPEAAHARRAHQGELARMSAQGEQVIARRSGHFPQRSEPRLVLRAMARVAAQAGCARA